MILYGYIMLVNLLLKNCIVFEYLFWILSFNSVNYTGKVYVNTILTLLKYYTCTQPTDLGIYIMYIV